MSVLRKLALTLLLIAIAPAMVLSGMPVKHCVSSAGEHQAIEFVINGVAHGGNHGSHHQEHAVEKTAFAKCGTIALAEPQTCVDTSLTKLAPSFVAELEFLKLPAITAASFPVVEPSDFAQSPLPVARTERLRTDPRMSAHRITVLRI